jgi:predicted PurR-regulated permease PerM
MKVTGHVVAAWILAGVALAAILVLQLLPALLAGLLVYELAHVLAPRLRFLPVEHTYVKMIAVAILSNLIVLALVAAGFGLWVLLQDDAGGLTVLLIRLAEIIEGAKERFPVWMTDSLPDSAWELRQALVVWLKAHAKELQHFGAAAGRSLAYIVIGMIIGAMLALQEVRGPGNPGPLAAALRERGTRLGDAFRRVVFAQFRISLVNTALTALFLVVILPWFGIRLPLVPTLIAITFFAGLLPVIGNLISNTVIVIVGASHSPAVAIACLVFLILIHKGEYFLNARIIGTRIQARAWELLVAMLVLEAVFGVAGLIAAPIYYAYLKDELRAKALI